MTVTGRELRRSSCGQNRGHTPVDGFGVWLDSRTARRSADFAQSRSADFGCGYEATCARTQLGVARSALLVDPPLHRISKTTAR
jgi:hypothetical protein